MHSLTHIAVFTRVVDSGSFTAAAHQLGMSKPTVSKHISMLEAHLGARLLNRTTRSLGLTEVGANFYGHCRNIMAELEVAEGEVVRSGSAPRGRLRVSAPTCFGDRWVAPALPEFLDMYPDLEIDLALDNGFVDLIRDGFDLAIRITREPPAGLGFRRLAPFLHLVYGAPGYGERFGWPETPRHLAGHNCLINPYFAAGDCWQLSGPNGVEAVKVAGRFRADDGGALRSAVLAGCGLALMPSFLVAADVVAGRLCDALPGYRENSFAVYAVYPETDRIAPKVQAFLNYLEPRLGACGPRGQMSDVGCRITN